MTIIARLTIIAWWFAVGILICAYCAAPAPDRSGPCTRPSCAVIETVPVPPSTAAPEPVQP